MALFGVKVLCIEPGFFKTGMADTRHVQNSFQKIWDRLPQDVRDDYGSDYIDQRELNTHCNKEVIGILHSNRMSDYRLLLTFLAVHPHDFLP